VAAGPAAAVLLVAGAVAVGLAASSFIQMFILPRVFFLF
jgi:hypothetical protein